MSGRTGDELLTLKVFMALARHTHSSRRLQNVLVAIVPFLVISNLPFGRKGESTGTLELSEAERYALILRSLALASRLLELVEAVANDIPLLMKASSAANRAIRSGEHMASALKELAEYCDMVDEKDRKDQDRAKEYERELWGEMQKLEPEGDRKGVRKSTASIMPRFAWKFGSIVGKMIGEPSAPVPLYKVSVILEGRDRTYPNCPSLVNMGEKAMASWKVSRTDSWTSSLQPSSKRFCNKSSLKEKNAQQAA